MRFRLLMLMLVGWAFCPFLHATEWGPDTRLTYDDSLSSVWSHGWNIATTPQKVNVVWFDRRNGNDEIYYKRSTDGGGTWLSDVRLTNNADRDIEPCIAANSSYVHIAWSKVFSSPLRYRKSTDYGATWLSETVLPTGGVDPCIATDNENYVHITYMDISNRLWYLRSTDVGSTWESPIMLSPFQLYPCVVTDTMQRVHVVYDSLWGPPYWYYVRYRRSTDKGSTWENGVILDTDYNTTWFGCPKIATDKGNMVHAIWYRPYTGSLLYRRSTDGGAAWQDEVALAGLTDNDRYSITADNEHGVHVVYTSGGNSLYYRTSTDDGASWQPAENITTSPSALDYPHIASFDTNSTILNVVWEDSRDGNNEIYYKRGRVIIGADESERQTLSDSKLTVMPNPFSHRTNIRYQMTENNKFEIRNSKLEIALNIYDASGRVVKTFSDNLCNLDNSVQSVGWDGRDDNGQLVPQGIYFVTLKTDKFVEIKKVVLMR